MQLVPVAGEDSHRNGSEDCARKNGAEGIRLDEEDPIREAVSVDVGARESQRVVVNIGGDEANGRKGATGEQRVDSGGASATAKGDE